MDTDTEPDEPPNKKQKEDEGPSPSQATPPKNPRREHPTEFPSDLMDNLSKAVFSNKTHSCFAIYTTMEKGPMLYKKVLDKFHCNFISRHGYDVYNLLYILTPSRHRVSAIVNHCNKYCSVSFVLVKAVIREYPMYRALITDPYKLIEESVIGGLTEQYFQTEEIEEKQQVSWKKVQEFALATMCDDVHLLMGLYIEFEKPVDGCVKCDKELYDNHYKYHKEHHENAKLFADSKNQKGICQQGADAVIAKMRVNSMVLTRKEMLTLRFKYHLDKMAAMFGRKGSADLRLYMAGVAWLDSLFPTGMKDILTSFLQCMIDNIPKTRYWWFTGPINTGKTTLAASFLDLCGGRSLNINIPYDKISFELGVAMDQYMVVFEDVKGIPQKDTNLPAGPGINNLDNLRDYLDGSVKVNLERKHQNKKSQFFPPGIVTMNEYKVPNTLKARFCKKLVFRQQDNLFKSLKHTPNLMKYRVLQSGITSLLLLIHQCSIEEFVEDLHEDIAEWKQRIDIEVGDANYNQMKENVQLGINILHTVQNTESDGEEDTQPSNNESVSPTATQM